MGPSWKWECREWFVGVSKKLVEEWREVEMIQTKEDGEQPLYRP